MCHHTRPPWVAGPTAGRFPYPGLPWKSSVPAAESFCRTILLRCGRGRGLPGPWLPWHCPGKFGRGKPLPYAHQSKKCGNFQGLFVSSPSRTALTRPPSTAGWIPQGGGRPRLWRFFPRFLIAEKSGPAERASPRQGRKPAPKTWEKSHLPILHTAEIKKSEATEVASDFDIAGFPCCN